MDGEKLAEVWDGRQKPRSTPLADGERRAETAAGRPEPRSRSGADCYTLGQRREGTESGAEWAGDGRTALTL